MTHVLSVVDRQVAYMEKSRKFYKKTEEYVEMNKLTLNTKKTELIFFSRDNSDFRSIFFTKTKFSQHKKVADILVFKLTGILVLRSS